MPRRRTTLVLTAAIVVTVLTLAILEPLRQMRLGHTVTSTDAPDEADMRRFVAAGVRSADRLAALWNTRRIVQRLYVASELRETPDDDPGYKALLLEAVRTRDPEIQQPAFYGLLRHHRADARAESLALLSDSDPEVVLLALRTLASAGDTATLSHVFPLLDSADLRLAIAAQTTLSRITGQSPPEYNLRLPAEPLRPQLHWQSAIAALPAVPGTELPQVRLADPFEAPDLTLTLMNGTTIRLAELRGKRIVLNFWATWCGPCIDEMPTLQALSRDADIEVVVIGVCVDQVAGPIPEHPPLRQRVESLLARQHVTYDNAIDTTGDATLAAAATGVPLTLLIGRDGQVHRRFSGPRELDSLIRMIGELP